MPSSRPWFDYYNADGHDLALGDVGSDAVADGCW
jgi:hypothetical protein